MGQQGRAYILVVMTNGDVYYISKADAEKLRRAMWSGGVLFEVLDQKSRAHLSLHVPNISSVVAEVHRA